MHGTTLLLPVAGRSSRYPGMRPKWLLTHPRGTLMLTEAIRGLDPSQYGRIVIVALASHEKEYGFSEAIVEELAAEYGIPRTAIQVLLLKHETGSQPETIYEGLTQAGVQGPFLVKDSDNHFAMPKVPAKNGVAVIDLNLCKPILVGNKSYVLQDERGLITEIVEKQVISNWFCCGGYFFESAERFCRQFERLREQRPLYPSTIIEGMIRDGDAFQTLEAWHFEDWGTLPDWTSFKEGYATLLIELDGVVVLDSHRHFEPRWGATEALRRNAQTINRLYESGKTEIILITSRTEAYEAVTRDQLRKNSIRFHRLLMGLPSGSRRMLVSGFSENTPYPAAEAVNLRVNDDRLDEHLQKLLS